MDELKIVGIIFAAIITIGILAGWAGTRVDYVAIEKGYLITHDDKGYKRYIPPMEQKDEKEIKAEK